MRLSCVLGLGRLAGLRAWLGLLARSHTWLVTCDGAGPAAWRAGRVSLVHAVAHQSTLLRAGDGVLEVSLA